MKFIIPILLMFILTGCTSFQRALETAERVRADMEEAGAELRDALEVVERARNAYEAALTDGDRNEIQAALEALRTAENERRRRELVFNETQDAFDRAGAELERARQEDMYLEGVLGLLLGGLVGGGGGFLTGRRRGQSSNGS